MISVVLGTSRPSLNAIRAWPDVDHLVRTLRSLAEQVKPPDYEVIVADVLRGIEWRDTEALVSAARSLPVPVYHVPVTSPWFARHLPAICATKNTGIAHAAGEHVIFIDDCCWLPEGTLAKYAAWATRGLSANALHIKTNGGVEGNRDSRFYYFRDHRYVFDEFDLAGYMSAPMEAVLRVNGFDEALDGTRQLEDIDFGVRLKAAGVRLVLDPELIVQEEEHHAAVAPDGTPYLGGPRCNGTFLFLHKQRHPGRRRANEGGWTAEEVSMIRPCTFLAGRCCSQLAPGTECNMFGADGVHLHAALPDEFMVTPVFDLAERRQAALAVREQYRIA